MAASSDANLQVVTQGFESYPVAAATTIYKGSMVSVVDGNATILTDGLRFNGHAKSTVINTTAEGFGTAGDLNVDVLQGRYKLQITLAGITAQMVGAYVYAVDDNTYTLAPMETPVGRVSQYVAASTAIVEFDTSMSRETMGAGVNGSFLPFRKAPTGAATALLGAEVVTTVVDGGGDAAHSITVIKASRGKAYNSGLIITTDDAENDGVGVQWAGEPFLLDSTTKPFFFGCKFQLGDVTQTDFFIGVSITDTTLIAGATDDISFRSVDGAATVELIIEKDSTETASGSLGTMVDATDIALGFLYNGTNVVPYVNGVAGTALAITNLPDNEGLCVSIEYLTGEAAAQTATINFIDAYQIV